MLSPCLSQTLTNNRKRQLIPSPSHCFWKTPWVSRNLSVLGCLRLIYNDVHHGPRHKPAKKRLCFAGRQKLVKGCQAQSNEKRGIINPNQLGVRERCPTHSTRIIDDPTHVTEDRAGGSKPKTLAGIVRRSSSSVLGKQMKYLLHTVKDAETVKHYTKNLNENEDQLADPEVSRTCCSFGGLDSDHEES